jgi:hypothetical protein
MPSLCYDVLVVDGVPRAGEHNRLPNGDRIVSSPLS